VTAIHVVKWRIMLNVGWWVVNLATPNSFTSYFVQHLGQLMILPKIIWSSRHFWQNMCWQSSILGQRSPLSNLNLHCAHFVSVSIWNRSWSVSKKRKGFFHLRNAVLWGIVGKVLLIPTTFVWHTFFLTQYLPGKV